LKVRVYFFEKNSNTSCHTTRGSRAPSEFSASAIGARDDCKAAACVLRVGQVHSDMVCWV